MSSEKPPWIETIPGVHPAFKPLSKEEAEKLALEAIEEAKRLGDGQGAQFMTADQKFLKDAETRRVHHKANALMFAENIGSSSSVGYRDRLAEEIKHRKWWAEAAIDLGKLAEAKMA